MKTGERFFLYGIITLLVVIIGVLIVYVIPLLKTGQADSVLVTTTNEGLSIVDDNSEDEMNEYQVLIDSWYQESSAERTDENEVYFEGYLTYDNRKISISGKGKDNVYNLVATSLDIVVQSDSQGILGVEVYKNGEYFDEETLENYDSGFKGGYNYINLLV